MRAKVGDWNADKDTQCVAVDKKGGEVLHVTVRSNAPTITAQEAKSRTMALKAAPSDALNARAMIYTSFTSQGYLYMTFVVTWL